MEILSIVVEGALGHKDSLGTGSVIRPGEVQRITAGTGVRHSEFNPSPSDEERFLQIWIEPRQAGLPPSYEQRAFDFEEMRNRWRLVASPDGKDGSLTVHQDVEILRSQLTEGARIDYSVRPGRQAWIHVIEGAVGINGARLEEGDGAAIESPDDVVVTGTGDVSDLLLFDLA